LSNIEGKLYLVHAVNGPIIRDFRSSYARKQPLPRRLETLDARQDSMARRKRLTASL
jgi:hypothetical protein